MKRALVLLLFFVVGCSTNPWADFLDVFKPGRLGEEKGAPYGGVCQPKQVVSPPAPPLGALPGPVPPGAAPQLVAPAPTPPGTPPPLPPVPTVPPPPAPVGPTPDVVPPAPR